jgi:hypothetical protein
MFARLFAFYAAYFQNRQRFLQKKRPLSINGKPPCKFDFARRFGGLLGLFLKRTIIFLKKETPQYFEENALQNEVYE